MKKWVADLKCSFYNGKFVVVVAAKDKKGCNAYKGYTGKFESLSDGAGVIKGETSTLVLVDMSNVSLRIL